MIWWFIRRERERDVMWSEKEEDGEWGEVCVCDREREREEKVKKESKM